MATLCVIASAFIGVTDGSARSLPDVAPSAPTSTTVRTSVDEAPEPASVPGTSVGDPVPSDVETTLPVDTSPEESPPDEGSDDVPGATGDAPRVEPTVRTTEIPPVSIVLAIAVLAAVSAAWWIASRRRSTAAAVAPPTAELEGPQPVQPATLGFLLELGEALVDAGDAVYNVAATLECVARVNGTVGFGAIVLPTALIISVPGAGSETTDVAIAGRSRLRLDQIESVIDLVDRAERGDLTPADGRRELRAIRSRPHPSSALVQLAGSAVAAAGLALVLRGGVAEVLLAAMLGALVGVLTQATATARYLYRPFWPLLASFVVAAAAFTALRLADVVVFPALVAPLITFLPGALLTIGVLELATGQILAGSARLASGSFQLVLLALGIVAGAQLVGVPASAVGSVPEGPVALAGPWAGVALFGVGIVWSQGLRVASILPILVVIYVAYAGQVVGGVLVGSALSSFFGAVAMTLVAVFLARHGLGPPTMVTFFPGFWILVPGALGLEGVTRILGDDRIDATGALTTALISMIGIALGVLLGLALSVSDPERPWTAGGRFRRA
jgi:uncharacterized membrane protein YjjP (DUF1212 family)